MTTAVTPTCILLAAPVNWAGLAGTVLKLLADGTTTELALTLAEAPSGDVALPDGKGAALMGWTLGVDLVGCAV